MRGKALSALQRESGEEEEEDEGLIKGQGDGQREVHISEVSSGLGCREYS